MNAECSTTFSTKKETLISGGSIETSSSRGLAETQGEEEHEATRQRFTDESEPPLRISWS